MPIPSTVAPTCTSRAAIKLLAFPDAHNGLGIAYSQLGDAERARAEFDEAIRIDAGYAPAYNSRGGLSFTAKEYDRAIADYDEAIRLDPNYTIAYHNRGLAYAAKEDYDHAIADYSDAIRLDPLYAVAFDNRGDAYRAKQDHEHAIADYSEAIRIRPDYAVAYNDRGEIYREQGDGEHALADLNEAIRIDPALARAYNNRGNLYLGNGDYEHALAHLNEAIRIDPAFASAYDNRGTVYLNVGDYTHALADLDEAIRLDPNQGWSGVRGLVHFYAANYGASAADLSAVLPTTGDPARVMLWRYLARAHSAGAEAGPELEANAKNLKPADWPYALVEMFLGSRTPDAALAAATNPSQVCEARFYAGEWRLLHGDRAAATDDFKTAVDTCPKTFVERAGAEAELKRLAP